MSKSEDIEEFIQKIKSEIMETFVFCVEEVLTEYLHNPKYLDEYYINEEAFRELIGLETFSDLKEKGKFDKAMHPATTTPKGEEYDNKRKYLNYHRYHRWFNVYKQEIEIPDQNRPSIERPKPTLKLLKPKDIEAILETAVFCVERVLTEYFRSPKYLDEYYIDYKEFCELIGLSSSSKSFAKLKKGNKFDKAMLPKGEFGKYHRWFNHKTEKIELPEWGAKKEFKGK